MFVFAFANQRQQDGGTAQTPTGLLLRVWDNVGHNMGGGRGFSNNLLGIGDILCRYLVFGVFSEHLRIVSHELMNNRSLQIWECSAKSYFKESLFFEKNPFKTS